MKMMVTTTMMMMMTKMMSHLDNEDDDSGNDANYGADGVDNDNEKWNDGDIDDDNFRQN